MGNSPSSPPPPPTPMPAPYCDAACEREKNIASLKSKYDKLRNEEIEIKSQTEKAKNDYYSSKYGPSWIDNEKKKELANERAKIRKEKEVIIDNLVKQYNSKIHIAYTQNNLINKQNLIINGESNNRLQQTNNISELNELDTTQRRAVLFKELEYRGHQKILYRFRLITFILFVILILLLIFKGGLSFRKKSITNNNSNIQGLKYTNK